MPENRLRLGDLLIESGVLQQEQLDAALEIQKTRQLRLGTVLLQENYVTEPQLIQALSRCLSIPWVNLWHIDIPDRLLELVPASVAEEFFLIPIYIRTTGSGEQSLYVAMNDPTDEAALRFVAASSNMSVKPMIAAPSDIASSIRYYYYGEEDMLSAEQPQQAAQSRQQPAMSAPPPPPVAGHAGPSKQPPAPLSPSSPAVMRASAPPKMPPAPPPVVAKGDAVPPPPVVPPVGPRANASELEEAEIDLEEAQDLSNEEPSVAQLVSIPPDSDPDTKQELQRQVEKHMFGVGQGKKARKALSLTLLDGTTIAFGGATKRSDSDTPRSPSPPDKLTQEDFIAGLKAAAKGTPIEGYLPSDQWEDYMAALLSILFQEAPCFL